jgi:hypothetical protein
MPDQLTPQERRAVGALEAARSFLSYTAESIGPNIGNHLRAAIKAIDLAADKLGARVSVDLPRSFLLDAAELCPKLAPHLHAAIHELDLAADKLGRVDPLPEVTPEVTAPCIGERCGGSADLRCPLCHAPLCYACARGHSAAPLCSAASQRHLGNRA